MNAADRVLQLSGVHNLRDYGGYATTGGGRLARAMLFRSGEHHRATDEDLTRIARLGLGAVVDLRSRKERMAAPCRRPDGFSARTYAADEDSISVLGPHMEAARTKGAAFDATALMCQSYALMPFQPQLTAALKLYFQALVDADGPTLVLCAMGKDRTGFAVALLHRAMGAHKDDVMADYMLTNTAGDSEARLAEGTAHLRPLVGAQVADSTIVQLLEVRPDYLESAFRSIGQRFSGLDDYIAHHLETPHARIEAIRERLTR